MLFNAVAQLVTRTASQRPALLLLDDLHWADEGTLLLLNYLSPLIAKIPVLVLGTYRDFELQLTRPLAKTLDEMIRLHLVERITLDGLPQSAVAEMLRMLNGSQPPEALTALFYSETEGNPFFVEELYSHLVEQGKLIDSAGEFRCDLKLEDIDVPQSLRLVIGRRLARLSDATQKTLGTAAVIGRSFTFDVLEASTPSNADSLLDCIEEAERAGLILSTVDYPDARFMFSHELIRQTVESGLSAPRRRRLHLNVANAIEHVYSNALVEHAEDLAHHLWRAGAIAEAEKTVRYLAMAARQASTRSANLEAIAHLTKVLNVLRALPDSSQRSQQELAFQVNLGMSLTSAKGYSAPDVRRAYARARDLCEQLGETPQLYPVLWGLWAYYLVSGDYKASHEIGQHFLTLAEQQNDTDLLLEAHTSEGLNFFYGGCDLDSARMHFESALSLYDPETHRGHALLYVQDPAIVTRSVLAWILWLQGYPEQALATHRECLRRAREQSHSYSLAYALAHGGTLCQFRRDIQLGRKLAEQGITLSSEQGFSYFLLAAKYTLGWALNQLSQTEEAITILRDATNASRAIGAQATRPHQLGLLAEALARANRADEGLAVLSDALAEVRSTREEYYEAELHRLRGELFLIQPRPNEDRAAAAFLQSLEVARHQHAKSWELRAATSLFRLKLKQGSSEQARQTLASIYGWFTEGFDTPDLQDAEALLRMSRAI
jgi:predicted ATPase